MDTGVNNPIVSLGGKYIDDREINKDENVNKSSQNKIDPYLSGDQLWSSKTKKNQSNNTQENNPINPFYKGAKTFEQNRSQRDINNNNNIINNNNNNMAYSSDQIKQLAPENDFQISINNQISSINLSMNNQNQLMSQI